MHVAREYSLFVFIFLPIVLIAIPVYGSPLSVSVFQLKSILVLLSGLLLGVLVLIGIVLFLNYQRKKTHRINQGLIQKIKINQIQQENIHFKADDLYKSNLQLIESNKTLESMILDLSQKLYTKNAKLKAYAFANAHQLRAPVARILGLLNLIKQVHKEDLDDKFIAVLQECALELDEIIKKTGKELESDYLTIDQNTPTDNIFPMKSKT